MPKPRTKRAAEEELQPPASSRSRRSHGSDTQRRGNARQVSTTLEEEEVSKDVNAESRGEKDARASTKTAHVRGVAPSSDDAHVEQFRQTLRAESAALDKLLLDNADRASAATTTFRTTIHARLSSALTPSTTPSTEGATIILQASRALLADYDTAVATFASTALPNLSPAALSAQQARWEADKNEVRRLLELGRRVTLTRIRRGLGVDSRAEGSGEVGVGEEREYEAVAKGFGERSEAAGEGGKRKELGGLGMDETLRYAERGVRRLVKGLPREEEV
ncbi:hypothetical protein W97_06962 [Coniosporium apollinis CBS 100218]|uniref:Uncharacterized protein n=1 Tax=Coniosporium apollinis (strain CBS 100218) TaxID=1168221 RepID=R7Z0Q1_CONA1|nr:uncharacterized protein W97_06962 [Coniosporium apollinis CBS 100218]EON67594.1 hypothetical protein W97_06962 [Coniosporium apollinis CBS 100218]